MIGLNGYLQGTGTTGLYDTGTTGTEALIVMDNFSPLQGIFKAVMIITQAA